MPFFLSLVGLTTFVYLQFTLWRLAVYQVICERLETIDRIADAVDCFNEMMTQLGGEAYISERISNWVGGEKAFHLIVCLEFNLL